jgi:hypothetical protein
MELEAIRALIRAKMQDGRLPCDSVPQAFGHPGRRDPEQRVEVISVPVGGATYEHRARVAETRYAQAVPHAGDGRSVLRLLSDDGITAELTRAK